MRAIKPDKVASDTEVGSASDDCRCCLCDARTLINARALDERSQLSDLLGFDLGVKGLLKLQDPQPKRFD